MNNDVVIEILVHLPVKSLLKFRAVCKFWRDVIDSPSFEKRHYDNINEDDMVYLQFTFLDDNCGDWELSIKLLDNGKLLKRYDDFNVFPVFNNNSLVKLVGEVKGLICFKCFDSMHPIAICNPSLGEFKILPKSLRKINLCRIVYHNFGIGFDEDYKVVELLSCVAHDCTHAHLYSRREDSWRDLGTILDQDLVFVEPMKSSCKNGYFAHWQGHRRVGLNGESIILSFDMKREVFRAITMIMPEYSGRTEILAKDECSFILFVLPSTNLVRVYESRFEDSILIWNHVMDVTQRPCRMPLWRSDCVVFKNFFGDDEFSFYDFRARKFVGSLQLPEPSEHVEYDKIKIVEEIVEYEGSLISP